MNLDPARNDLQISKSEARDFLILAARRKILAINKRKKLFFKANDVLEYKIDFNSAGKCKIVLTVRKSSEQRKELEKSLRH